MPLMVDKSPFLWLFPRPARAEHKNRAVGPWVAACLAVIARARGNPARGCNYYARSSRTIRNAKEPLER